MRACLGAWGGEPLLPTHLRGLDLFGFFRVGPLLPIPTKCIAWYCRSVWVAMFGFALVSVFFVYRIAWVPSPWSLWSIPVSFHHVILLRGSLAWMSLLWFLLWVCLGEWGCKRLLVSGIGVCGASGREARDPDPTRPSNLTSPTRKKQRPDAHHPKQPDKPDTKTTDTKVGGGGFCAWGQSRQPKPCGKTIEVNRVVLRGVASHASRAARQSETTNTEPTKPHTNPHNPQHATHNTRPRQRTQAPKGILRWVPWHRQFDWVARVCLALVSLPILVSVLLDC